MKETERDTNVKILVIDDDSTVRLSLELLFEDEGAEVTLAENGYIGIEKFISNQPDVVFLDLKMPGIGGMEVLCELGKITDLVPIIIVSGNNEINEAVEALRNGAWDYICKPILDLDIILHRMNLSLNKAALLRENRMYHDQLEERVKDRTNDLLQSKNKLSEAIFNTILVLTQAIEAKDSYTRGHCSRVSKYSVALGKKMDFTNEQLYNLQNGALLHDIGKIGIPEAILNKPGKLTVKEYEIIKNHPEIGASILENIDYFKPITNIILHHHVWFNGEGCPDAITGYNTESSEIVALADVYDSLVTTRPYRSSMSVDKALGILIEHKGSQFRPELVDLFLNEKIYQIKHDDKLKIEFDFQY